MRQKHRFFLLLALLLTGMLAIGLVFSVSADGPAARIIQLSPNGLAHAYAVAWSPDGQTLAVGTSLGINYYNTSTLQLIRFTQSTAWVRSLAYSPDGTILASGGYDPLVRLYRAGDGTLLAQLKGHTAWVRSVAFSPNGKLLASASDDNTVRLWDMPDGQLDHILNNGLDGVRTLAFSPDGSILATGGVDNVIRFWQVSDGKLLRELKGSTGWIRALAFSPDGQWLASGGFDHEVHLWRVADGTLMVTRQDHSSSITGLSFSPDGTLLASSDVDTTVRLWKMPSLQPYDLLKGHTDFVFSVAFSPDGKEVASGGADNTLRLWDVPAQASPDALEYVPSTQTCDSCHHPRGAAGPARVVEVTCSTCHAEGALGLNWCPAFERSPGDTTVSVQLQPQELNGFYSQTPAAAVIINSPGNGQVVYGHSDVSYPVDVLGRVFYQGALSDVRLTLDIIADDGSSTTLQTAPLSDGTFSFFLEGNHGANLPASMIANGTFIAGQASCTNCHNKQFDGALPAKGTVQLKVSMSTSAGVQATDERVISVDPGGNASIPVQVLLDNGQPAANIPVQADTRLYEWRGRSFTGTSDSSGRLTLPVEALSQNPTTYQISIPPTVVDGVLYQSKADVRVELPAGATGSPAVTLHAQTTTGAIAGHLDGLAAPVRVWAISTLDGSARIATTSAQGGFAFDKLPVTQYLLLADPQELAKQGLALLAESVDLTQSPSAQVNLAPQPLTGAPLTGKVTGANGAALPFAWVSLDSQTGQAAPGSGAYNLFGLTAARATAIISAPGYYSQAYSIDTHTGTASALDFSLVRRPDTRSIAWGAGSITLPSETISSQAGQKIDFTQGWLWGKGASEKPVLIQLEDMQISLPAGQFALERLPGQPAWLYLISGQASIQQSGAALSIPVKAGQMVLLNPGQLPVPVPYDPVVSGALHAANLAPLSPVWQPSLSAQLRDRLARIGIGTAQAVTFITYLMEVLALLAMGFLAVKWVIKVINEKRNN